MNNLLYHLIFLR